ncbi:hypothetical protein [Nostoc sp. 106C]|nr:hypothetical protein [Nostoc sp. 106C]
MSDLFVFQNYPKFASGCPVMFALSLTNVTMQRICTTLAAIAFFDFGYMS